MPGAVAAVGALLLGSVPAAAAPSPVAGATVPDRYLEQRIQWKPCFAPGEVPEGLPAGSERLECGSYHAPRNWNRPEDRIDITIAVSRLRPAGGEPKGAVLTNPGGPGAPGRTLPLVFLGAGRGKLLDSMDVIGIDVRGSGDSTRASCGGMSYPDELDPRDRSSGNLDLIYDSMALLARHCQVRSGEFGRYVNTEQTAKDLDLLRQLLGRERVHWIGYSGGTWLGAYYATYFPDRVGRFVLDSNTEFTATWQRVVRAFGKGGERRFRVDFAPWVARYDQHYRLGSTGAQVRLTYEQVRAALAERPVRLPDGTEFTAPRLDTMLFRTQYAKASFPAAADTLVALREATRKDGHAAGRGVAAALARMGPMAGESVEDASNGMGYSIVCNDTEFIGDRRMLIRESARLGKRYPLYGWYQRAAPCASWDRPYLRMPTPDGAGLPPVLMVQSVRDPATPVEGAWRAHQRFAGSRMLTVTDEGDHGIYASGNPCVDRIVESFVVDGMPPEGDVSCPGMPLPEPGARTAHAWTPNPVLESERLELRTGALPR
ncbi:alpha/beta hydrolase [Amycolatopsis aidingensis]|uniref:alpha/beta hydrolase n=1 Tax=Amycolatopsis aidingensis TaxID=2842453 RepID=UPI001E51AF2A|nr:alpha/beta hydrolase [Amycolatopsis aidingensis]